MENESIEIVAKPYRVSELVKEYFQLNLENNDQNIFSGYRKECIEFLIRINIAWLVFKNFKNPFKCIKILKSLDEQRRRFMGESRIRKIVRVSGKYYWELYLPGWPSQSFDRFIEAEINRISPIRNKTNRFTNIFIAITKKCPLQCEHCFEWEALNRKEKLTLNDIQSIVQSFQIKGTGQIQLSGGEPMLRINDIVEVLNIAKKGTDFWVLTSGFNLTLENSRKLKNAGLTGVFISLDHFEPEMHNLFRGFENSFEWVKKAVKCAIASDLVVALSICVTKSFVTESNLMEYSDLAKRMGVSFIQILEPKAVGHFKSKDVLLNHEHEKILEAFYLRMNYDLKYRSYPIISYHGYHQRRIGCTASGNRILYVDTDGDLKACPFCQTKTGSALAENLDQSIEELQSAGCPSFKNASI